MNESKSIKVNICRTYAFDFGSYLWFDAKFICSVVVLWFIFLRLGRLEFGVRSLMKYIGTISVQSTRDETNSHFMGMF